MDQQITELVQVLLFARAKLDATQSTCNEQAAEIIRLNSEKAEYALRSEAAVAEAGCLTEDLLHSRS